MAAECKSSLGWEKQLTQHTMIQFGMCACHLMSDALILTDTIGAMLRVACVVGKHTSVHHANFMPSHHKSLKRDCVLLCVMTHSCTDCVCVL